MTTQPDSMTKDEPGFMQADFEKAAAETARLQRELDITNADHIALWLEANMPAISQEDFSISWLACRIIDAHEQALAATTPSSADNALREALAYYAEEARWTMNSAGITPAMDDRGYRARQALASSPAAEVEPVEAGSMRSYRDVIAYSIIEGSAGIRAAEHAKDFQTANWTDALRSADAVIASLSARSPSSGEPASVVGEENRALVEKLRDASREELIEIAITLNAGVRRLKRKINIPPKSTPVEAGALDWRRVAKLAGEFGIRYRTNAAFEQFLAALSQPGSSESGGEQVERVAQWLHDEGGFDDAWSDRTWPEHPDDTGQREGGYVKLVPSDVQTKFREVAARLMRRFPSALPSTPSSKERQP
ncbi:hypothetical protein SAMN02927924_01450 [Sphingobium faniae]|nr:hypothetical protein SAMN02927924_01450 [Sphingobium faniae]